MELWLVRHGETMVGEDGLYQPHHGLTDLGREQARSVAQVLVKTDFDVCYTSELPRAIETAETFAALSSNHVVRIGALNEIDAGRIDLASTSFKKRVVNHQVALDFSQFGGENEEQFALRIADGLDQLLDDARAKNARRVLGFLHGGTIGAILDRLAGRDFKYQNRPRMPNCAYTVVREEADGRWSDWQGWNSEHLPALT